MKTKSATCQHYEGQRSSALKWGTVVLTLFVLVSILSCTSRRYGYLTTRVKAKNYHSVNRVNQRMAPPAESMRGHVSPSADPAIQLHPVSETARMVWPSVNAAEHRIPHTGEHFIFNSETRVVRSQQHTAGSRLQRLKSDALMEEIARAEKERTRLTRVFCDEVFLSVTGGILSSLLAFMLLFRNRSVSLARWASEHKVKARVLLIAGRTVLGVSGFLAGTWMQRYGFSLSDTAVWGLGGLMAMSVVLYPFRKASRGRWQSGFIQRKVHDLVLVVTGSALMFGLGNIAAQPVGVDGEHGNLQHVYSVTAGDQHQLQTTTLASAYEDRSDTAMSTGVKILLSLVALILYALVFYVTAILSCELSCAGHEGLAALVLVIGWIGGLVLFIYALRVIWRSGSVRRVPSNRFFMGR